LGALSEESSDASRRLVRAGAGADSVILGCTEIAMLLSASDSALPLFDTTAIHAEAGVAWIAGQEYG
jgi:aspartate racemase